MMRYQSQRGFTLLSIPGVLLTSALAGLVAYNGLQYEIENTKNEVSGNMRVEMLQVIDAFQSCYHDTRGWCDFTQIQNDYGGETGVSITGTNIGIVVNGDDLQLTFNTGTPEFTARLARYFKDPVINNSQLTITVNPPTASHIYTSNIQRYQDNEGFNRNRVDQRLDFDSHDIDNIDELDSQTGELGRYTANTQIIDTLTVNQRLVLGNNSLGFAGDRITVDTDSASFSGDISAGGNIIGTNTNITGVNQLTATEIASTTLAANNGSIEHASGTTISYTNADIDTITADDYSSDVYNAAALEAINLTTDRLNSDVTAQTGIIGQLTFQTGSGSNWAYSDTNVRTINAATSDIGVASADAMVIAGQVNGGSYAGGSASLSSLSTGNVNGGSFSGIDFRTSVSSVNDNYQLIILNRSAAASNTSTINSNSQRTAINSQNRSSNTSAISLTAQIIGGNQSQIQQNSNKSAINTSDLAREEAQLASLQGVLDNCMYVNQYCYPQDPVSGLSCPGCSAMGARSGFSATATGSVRDCRQGCSYSWSTSGSGLSFSGCSGGTVSKGGSASPSCSVSANLSTNQGATGTITLNVTNSHYTSRKSSSSVPVSFYNATPTASTSCSGCNASLLRSSFSATISASLTSCKQGCNYSWSTSGSGLSFSCPGGSVSAGGSGSPSCSVSANVSPAQTVTGSATINVSNSADSSGRASSGQSVSFHNLTPDLASCPAASFKETAGSFIVTYRFSQGIEGQTASDHFTGGQGCAGSGVSHVEGDATAQCTAAGAWNLTYSRTVCLKD